MAMVFPLFVKLATANQSKRIAEYIENNFLKEFGCVTTNVESG